MIPHGGEIILVELSQLMRRHRVSFHPELFQHPDGFGVFLIQRIDILQNRFGGTKMCIRDSSVSPLEMEMV